MTYAAYDALLRELSVSRRNATATASPRRLLERMGLAGRHGRQRAALLGRASTASATSLYIGRRCDHGTMASARVGERRS